MVIQRFQSLFLLIGFALIVAFVFMPFGYSAIFEEGSQVQVQEWYPYQFLGILIPAGVGGLLMFIDIFLFSNTGLQKVVAWVSILCVLAAAGVTIYVVCSGFNDVTPGDVIARNNFGGGGLLLIASALAAFVAISRIKADERILRSQYQIRN